MAKKSHDTLHDLLIIKLQALYDIESELLKSLPKMAEKATDPMLQAAFKKHLRETENQVLRLEEALKELGAPVKKEKSEGIRGMAEDASATLKTITDDAARDVAIIASAQSVEHYEIAAYGSAIEWAKLMGHESTQALLEESLAEEKEADMTLNDLALSGINEKANMATTIAV